MFVLPISAQTVADSVPEAKKKTELTVADSRTIIGDANKFPRRPSSCAPLGNVAHSSMKSLTQAA
jgi:hypothetical protein